MNRLAISVLAAVALCGSACRSTKGEVRAAEAAPPTVTVSAAQASKSTVSAGFDETGTFVADESSDIAPLVPGRVLATPVNVGQFVKRGQVICELDHRDAELRLRQVQGQLSEATSSQRQAQSRIGLTGTGTFDAARVPEVAGARANFESAEARARLAQADLQRYANLIKSGDVSRSAYETARTATETAQAQVNAARQQLEAAQNTARQSYEAVSTSGASVEVVQAQVAQAQKAVADTTIRAPFDGFITARNVAVGEYVALADKIATIVRINTMKLQLQSPEQRAARAKLGMDVTARVAAYPDRQFTGKVSAINPAVDPNSRSFVIEARFANPETALRPGMFATARVLLPGGEEAVFVPQKAVFRDRTTDSNQVYIIQQGRARLRVVLTGETDRGLVRILSGLEGTETVATSKQAELFDGAPVQTQASNR